MSSTVYAVLNEDPDKPADSVDKIVPGARPLEREAKTNIIWWVAGAAVLYYVYKRYL